MRRSGSGTGFGPSEKEEKLQREREKEAAKASKQQKDQRGSASAPTGSSRDREAEARRRSASPSPGPDTSRGGQQQGKRGTGSKKESTPPPAADRLQPGSGSGKGGAASPSASSSASQGRDGRGRKLEVDTDARRRDRSSSSSALSEHSLPSEPEATTRPVGRATAVHAQRERSSSPALHLPSSQLGTDTPVTPTVPELPGSDHEQDGGHRLTRSHDVKPEPKRRGGAGAAASGAVPVSKDKDPGTPSSARAASPPPPSTVQPHYDTIKFIQNMVNLLQTKDSNFLGSNISFVNFGIAFDPKSVFAPSDSFPLDVPNLSHISTKAASEQYPSMQAFLEELESMFARLQAFFAKRLALSAKIDVQPEASVFGKFSFPESADVDEEGFDKATTKRLLDWGKALHAMEVEVVKYVGLAKPVGRAKSTRR